MAKYKLPAEVLLTIGAACGSLHQAKDELYDQIAGARRIGLPTTGQESVVAHVTRSIQYLHQLVADCEEAT
jgi:hypothetical protein